MLVALAITAALLSASLAALDTSFKSYQMTSQSASTHVVTRIVMHRMLSMIRVGTEFGPYPEDVLATPTVFLSGAYVAVPEPPATLEGFQIEFVSRDDPVTGDRQITRLEARDADPADGTLVLWLIIKDLPGDGTEIEPIEQPLLRGVRDAAITLEYDVGPKLRRASIDLSVVPNDLGDEIDIGVTAPVIRLVASASPRNLD
jgi:hypothetical protein